MKSLRGGNPKRALAISEKHKMPRPGFELWSPFLPTITVEQTTPLVNHINPYTCTYTHIHMYLPNPSARAGCNTRSFLKRGLTGLNSAFHFRDQMPY